MEPLPSGEILLDGLCEGSNTFRFAISPEEINFEHEFYVLDGDIRADVTVRRSIENFHIEGSLVVVICGECCRCLGSLKEKVRAEIGFLLQRRQASQEELMSAEDDGGIEIVGLGTRAIDLVTYMRESLLLELPIRIPSEKVDGFCLHCGDGSTLNNYKGQDQSDPRWEKLKKVKFVE
jgi:uncharacterized metal-binding protein YceD (DUF177 family)